MKNKTVSIVVPCYNQAQYLPETLASVLSQTYQDWECIIVNDGSPDHTDTVALEWCVKDDRFKYLYKENGGLADARNKGVEQAIGKWIFPLDSDDLLADDLLERAVEAIQNNVNVGIVYSRAEYIEGKVGEWKLPKYSFELILRHNIIMSAALYEREDWVLVGGYDTKLIYGWEDWEFWINLLSTTSKVAYQLDSIGFYYRIKKDSMVTEISNDVSKMQYSENYVQSKHAAVYSKIFGTYRELLTSRDNWERKYKKTLEYKLKTFFKSIFKKRK